jgi:hypothetical protein
MGLSHSQHRIYRTLAGVSAFARWPRLLSRRKTIMTREEFEASLRAKLEMFRGEAGLSSGRLETYVRQLMPLYDEVLASPASDPGIKMCLECEQPIQVRADGKFVMHALPGFPIECQGSRKAVYA